MSKITIARTILRKIKYQFPETPEGKLWFSVLKLAILDSFDHGYRHEAVRYINGDMEAALICDVDPDWIRSLLLRHLPELNIKRAAA